MIEARYHDHLNRNPPQKQEIEALLPTPPLTDHLFVFPKDKLATW